VLLLPGPTPRRRQTTLHCSAPCLHPSGVAASKTRIHQQQLETLQAQLQEASAGRLAAETKLHELRKTTSAQKHRQQQVSAAG
jgi:hypothetical protein